MLERILGMKTSENVDLYRKKALAFLSIMQKPLRADEEIA
jgi:hypothetical protein